MSKFLKPFKIIREHWKKSVFFSGVALYGGYWTDKTRKEESIRQKYCDRAKIYGDRALTSSFQKTDCVLVLVNKAARDSRSRSMFTKNCAPILHLAGLDLVEKDWEGTYDSFEALDGIFKDSNKQYSAVMVVGGNRTVNAYLNYSMTQNKALPPAAFVPVGKDSVVMSRFLPFVGTSTAYVQRLCEVAFKVVEGTATAVDVLKIENKESSSDQPPHFLYAVSFFTFDQVTDTTHKGYKYWYVPSKLFKRFVAGVIGLVAGSYNERIFGEIEAIHAERPVLPEVLPVTKRGWFSSSPKTPALKVAPPPEPKVVKSDLNFDAEALTFSANHPNNLGSFLVEVSTKKPKAWKAFLAAVLQEHSVDENSFRATDVTLTLKLIPRHSRFYIDGVPHADFDRVVKVSIMPKAFKMFY